MFAQANNPLTAMPAGAPDLSNAEIAVVVLAIHRPDNTPLFEQRLT
jgi:hypothetical protein